MNAPAPLTLASDEYRTPEWFLDLVRRFNNGDQIGLDPCTTRPNPVGARAFYTKADNGLVLPWHGWGLVFVNCPYSSPNLQLWVTKAAREAVTRKVEVILLVPATPATSWWQDRIARADRICLPRKRIAFVRPSGRVAPSPRHDSAVVYWGPRGDDFELVFGELGMCFRPGA